MWTDLNQIYAQVITNILFGLVLGVTLQFLLPAFYKSRGRKKQ